MKQPTLARAWVFCFFGMHVAAYQLETAHAKDDAAVEAATQAKLHEAIALASDNTMFLHLHRRDRMTMEAEQASELLSLQHTGRVRGDLRAPARRGAHRDADAYRLRAQPFRTGAAHREIGWTCAGARRSGDRSRITHHEPPCMTHVAAVRRGMRGPLD